MTCGRPVARLARRRSVDRVELVAVLADVLERVGLHELVARVPGLRPVVDTDDVEARALVAAGAAAGAAEGI
jgi:hypothetical protein